MSGKLTVTPEMVEQAARAICCGSRQKVDCSSPEDYRLCPAIECVPVARAVIAAMVDAALGESK